MKESLKFYPLSLFVVTLQELERPNYAAHKVGWGLGFEFREKSI
jgi:hypothetical protein